MLADLRYAFRALRRAPGFTLLASLTLALGVGANAAIFSAINGVLLAPLPYREPDRIVRITEGRPGYELNVSYPNFVDWRARSRTLEDMAIFNTYSRAVIGGEGRPDVVPSATAESRLFTLLGVRPVVGRLFTADEEEPGGEFVVLISHALWLRRFGGSPAIVGRALTVDGWPATVVGVLPSEFRLLAVDIWRPLTPVLSPMQLDRANHPGFSAYGRLRNGAAVADAQRELSSIAADLERQYPVSNHQMGVFVRPLGETIVGGVRRLLLLVAGAVVLLLLIVCANVSNLLLARGLRRERETALRAALGAGRARLVRMFLSESVAVSLLGAAAGVLLAAWAVRALQGMTMLPLPRRTDIVVNGDVIAFALALSVLTSVLFGLAPALQLSRTGLMDRLRLSSSASDAPARSRLRGALIAVEVALSLALLVGAGLMIRTVARLMAVDAGFNAEGVLAVGLQQPPARRDEPDRIRTFTGRVLEELEAAPGIASAAASWPFDYVGFSWAPQINLHDAPFPPGQEPPALMAAVTPRYFETMGIRLLQGRVFAADDRPGAPMTAVVNEAFARRFMPGADPLGRRIRAVGIPALDDLRIVGVVGNTLRAGPAGRTSPEVYCAFAQFPLTGATIVVRSASGDPLQAAAVVEGRVAAIDPAVATFGARRLEDAVRETVGDRRALAVLLAVFAGLAVGLTAIGIGGVLSYVVAQRTQEIGVRMALGAQPGGVIAAVLRDALAPVLVGLLAGVGAAVPFTDAIRSFLFEVAPADPIALGGAACVLLAAALLGAWVPARRATRIDPLVALRME